MRILYATVGQIALGISTIAKGETGNQSFHPTDFTECPFTKTDERCFGKIIPLIGMICCKIVLFSGMI